MRLYLINDLPLFGVEGEPSAEPLIREEVLRLGSMIPATLTYLAFEDLQRLWASSVATPSEVLVLVGTRPPRLLARESAGRDISTLVPAVTTRTLDRLGHTESVTVTFDTLLDQLSEARELCVIDDVAMSGATLQVVLGRLRQVGARGSVTVRTMIATSRALERVCASWPEADIHAGVVLDFAPVEQGTVIFLRDLLYGTLRGQPFLSQTELLRPFFGGDLSALHHLRDAVTGG